MLILGQWRAPHGSRGDWVWGGGYGLGCWCLLCERVLAPWGVVAALSLGAAGAVWCESLGPGSVPPGGGQCERCDHGEWVAVGQSKPGSETQTRAGGARRGRRRSFDLNWATRGRHLHDLRLRPVLGVGLPWSKVSAPTFVPDLVFWCGGRGVIAAGPPADVLGDGLSGRELVRAAFAWARQ